MFGESPAKRRRITVDQNDSPIQTTPLERSARLSAKKTYLTRTKRRDDHVDHGASSQVSELLRVGVADSGYRSMATDEVASGNTDEVAGGNEMSAVQDAPSNKRRRTIKQSAVQEQVVQQDIILPVPAMTVDDNDDAKSTISLQPRTSSRSRKHTWKVAQQTDDIRSGRSPPRRVKEVRVSSKEAASLVPSSASWTTDAKQLVIEDGISPSTRKRGRPRMNDPGSRVSKTTEPLGRADANILTPQRKTPTSKRAMVKIRAEVLADPFSIEHLDEPGNVSVDNHETPAAEAAPTVAVSATAAEDIEVADQPDFDIALSQLQALLGQESYKGPLVRLRNNVTRCLTGKTRLPLQGLDDECQKVHQVIEQTVVAGEGNSMIIIGARGSGKTALVETILSEMASEHHQDFHVIRLNGFIHTDDKLAMREIWRQLSRGMEVDDGTATGRSNYADTMASLLAILSHSAEIDGVEQTEDTAAKSVVFMIDEFDLFASHPRQTLLYNLFDIAQSHKAPIAVLGLTTRIDVMESLEKRVKSRFSHRHVYLSLPRTFASFRSICLAALTASTELSSKTPPELDSDYQTLQANWSSYMSTLLSPSFPLDKHLRRVYATSKSVPLALTSFLLPIATLSPTQIPTSETFASQTLLPPDSKIDLLPSLSEIELALLIGAARLDVVLDTDTCNFNMAYDEYVTLANKMRIQSSASGALAVGGGARIWGREVAMRGWERLEELGLVVPLVGGANGSISSASAMAEVGRAGRLVRCDVSMEEIGKSRVEMPAIMGRWCREL